ncbi:hypothetical protein V1509DRAFT_611294 [Lipomyces kononenkoae]
MVTVAIAGGTGHIGKTLAEVLKASPNHKVLVLSRNAAAGHDEKAPIHAVNYDDVDSLAKLFEEDNVHTVISTIQVSNSEVGASEINLVRAAVKSSPTKRFIASDWGIPFPEPRADELRTTSLEWTTVHIGYIADYFGIPHVRSFMSPLTINIDIANKAAAIPGTGNDLVSFTYSFDVAKFVEAALDLPHWDQELCCYGDKCTLNEVVRISEEATGAKFSVSYDSIEQLREGKITELPSHHTAYRYFPKPILQSVFSKFGLYVSAGLFDMPADKSLNKLFPEIKTKTVREVISAWEGK